MSRPRLQILDLGRGLLFLNMAAYHALYDWTFIFGHPCPFMHSHSAYLWQQSICYGFILLAGCCSTLSRNPAKHGLQILGCGLLITVVTRLALPQEQILFGILHFTGSAYLLTALLKPLLAALPARPMLWASLALFLATRGIYYGYLGILEYPIWTVPAQCYQWPWLFPLGLPAADFASSDYFPLIPWFFLFAVGYWGGPLLLRSRPFALIQHWRLPALNWIGRNTLPLYMLHQPVIYGALWLLH